MNALHSTIKLALIKTVIGLHDKGEISNDHAERMTARLTGEFSTWLVSADSQNGDADFEAEETPEETDTDEQNGGGTGEERECGQCGDIFVTTYKNSRYCSKKCRQKVYREKRRLKEALNAS